jgi:Ohr subfamily peroxiredoxin
MGATPEQLFAVAWSASLESAISAAARQRKVAFPDGLVIEAAVDLCMADDACFLRAHLDVSLPGVDRDVARALLTEARQACVYSKATHGNIDVAVSLV